MIGQQTITIFTYETEINTIIAVYKIWYFVGMNESLRYEHNKEREALFLHIMYKYCKGNKVKTTAEREVQ